MHTWTETSLLKFHPDKCKCMHISTKKNKEPTTYRLGPGNKPLDSTTQEKDIGVIIDDKLTFDAHINAKINKANSVLGTIRRTFDYIDCDNFKHLYKALVRPHIEYANQIWCPHLQKHIHALEGVQRRATKLIPSLKDLPYHERLKKLQLPTLAYRRARGDMIELYKILSGKYDMDVSNFLTLSNQTNTRGHHLKLEKKRPKLNLRKYAFSHRTVNTWNNLPEDVISAPSTKSFERRLDSSWKNAPLLYNYTEHIEKSTEVANISSEEELTTEA